jgi:hypothetical protein
MVPAKISFRELIQDSQDYGSDDEHMVSRVFFDFEIEGSVHSNLYADVKQPVGSSFETAPLEVSRPSDYKGPFNWQCFRDAVEQYYRSLVGSQGRGIRIEGASNIRMRNNRFVQPRVVEYEVDPKGGSW